MPIPTEQVGSLPRSSRLQKALDDYDFGRIDKQDLMKEQDLACVETIRLLERTGSVVISDGEQRKSSFATYSIADTLNYTGLAEKLCPGGQDFAIFADGHRRQLPRLLEGRFCYKTYTAEYVEAAKKLTDKPIKQAVISPSMLALLYPLDDALPGYDRQKFEVDLVAQCTKDIRDAFAAGASRVSIDFTEGRLALRRDAGNPWTGRGMLGHFVALNNRVLANFTAAERVNIGIHTCPGGDCDSTHSADVDYADLLPSLFAMNAGYFLIQAASEPNRERVYQLIAKYLRRNANGVKQVAFIGVIDPLDPRIETPEEVRDALLLAAKYIPLDQLGATDDCGFSPFSIDRKPRHGSPDVARHIAIEKITARIKGAALASTALGI